MKKIFCLLFCLVTLTCQAQRVNMKKYMKGAVPVVEGVVMFSHDYTVAGASEERLFTLLQAFAGSLVEASDFEDYAKVTMQSRENRRVVANLRDKLVFSQRKWKTDTTTVSYRLLMFYEEGRVHAQLQDFVYSYEGDVLKAERWITDEYALKDGGKALRKGSGKFRKATVDFAEQLFARLEEALK